MIRFDLAELQQVPIFEIVFDLFGFSLTHLVIFSILDQTCHRTFEE